MYCPDMLRRLTLVITLVLTLVLLSACGGGSSSSAAPSTVIVGSTIPGANVLDIVSDKGPAGAAYQVNRLYTDVTICQPGTNNCQTIDHVLVDTGSTGLRLLASEVSPALGLVKLNGSTGFALLNCAQFVDTSFAWGPVAKADITLGTMRAASVPIQIVADAAYQPAVPSACGGIAITRSSAAALARWEPKAFWVSGSSSRIAGRAAWQQGEASTTPAPMPAVPPSFPAARHCPIK